MEIYISRGKVAYCNQNMQSINLLNTAIYVILHTVHVLHVSFQIHGKSSGRFFNNATLSMETSVCAANVFQGQAVCNITYSRGFPKLSWEGKKHIRCKHVSLFFTLQAVLSKQAFGLHRHSNRRSLVIGGFHARLDVSDTQGELEKANDVHLGMQA